MRGRRSVAGEDPEGSAPFPQRADRSARSDERGAQIADAEVFVLRVAGGMVRGEERAPDPDVRAVPAGDPTAARRGAVPAKRAVHGPDLGALAVDSAAGAVAGPISLEEAIAREQLRRDERHSAPGRALVAAQIHMYELDVRIARRHAAPLVFGDLGVGDLERAALPGRDPGLP